MIFRIYETDTNKEISTDSRSAILMAVAVEIVEWDVETSRFATESLASVRAFFDATMTGYFIDIAEPE